MDIHLLPPLFQNSKNQPFVFRIPLKIISGKKPEIDRWMQEHQGKHFCECGCGEAITILRRHYWHDIPRFLFKHRTAKEAHYVRQYHKQGLLTVGEICRRLGIGKTTYYRYEGRLYPAPKRKGKVRVFSEKDYRRIGKALNRNPRLKIKTASSASRVNKNAEAGKPDQRRIYDYKKASTQIE
jgi:hypothetical protein